MMLIQTRYVRISRRGAFLSLFGVAWMLIGYSYLHIPAASKPLLHKSLRFALGIAPIEFYGWAWITCGLLAVICGLVHRVDWVGFGAAMLMPVFWSLVEFAAQFWDGVPRAWVGGVVYAVFAGAIGLVAGMADPRDRRRRL